MILNWGADIKLYLSVVLHKTYCSVTNWQIQREKQVLQKGEMKECHWWEKNFQSSEHISYNVFTNDLGIKRGLTNSDEVPLIQRIQLSKHEIYDLKDGSKRNRMIFNSMNSKVTLLGNNNTNFSYMLGTCYLGEAGRSGRITCPQDDDKTTNMLQPCKCKSDPVMC